MARQYLIYHASTPVDPEVVPAMRPHPEASDGSRSSARGCAGRSRTNDEDLPVAWKRADGCMSDGAINVCADDRLAP